MKYFSYIVGVICAAAVMFAVHIKYGNFVAGVVNSAMDGTEIEKPPYSFMITLIATITSILPIMGLFILFFLVYDKIPGKSPLTKGILFGMLRLLSEGQLARMPIMNALVGNPLWVVVLQQSEIWATTLLISIILAYSVSFGKKDNMK